MRRFAGDADQALAALALPAVQTVPRAPLPMHDAMRLAAERHDDVMRKRGRLRQPLQPRRDPGAVLLRERPRLTGRLPRGGMVSTTSRDAASMRSV